MLQRMNIAALFIRRPVATALIMLGMLFFGAASYVNLPVNQLPNVDFPTIQVSADLSGADPETMAASVATPLEKEFFTIAGIDSISSVNATGRTRITIQFALDRDIDAAALDVQAAIGLAQRRLPTNMTNDPSFRKVNPADYPILYLRVGSPTLPLYELNEYADTLVGQRLSMVKGVAQVVIYGQKKYAVRVRVDPDALASRGLGIDEVADAVSNANSKLSFFILHSPLCQLEDAEAFRDVVAAYRNGAPVRLSDIGEVVDSVEQDKQLSWADDGKPCIMLAVERQPGANTVQVVDDIKTLLPGLARQLPPSVKLEIFYDRSESIRESVAEVKFTLVLTVFLVVLVIFLFLRNLPATIIPSLALPMSVISTFAVMLAMGFSLDNLSLMALTLAVGFVVDDAIVMLENIVRHQEMGKDPLTAAYDGSGEIGFTILSMTVSLAAVFIPVLFMGGIVGRLFYEFAVVIITAILFSGVVSLTLTPMLCAYFLRHSGSKHRVGYEGIYGKLDVGVLSQRDVLSGAVGPLERRVPADIDVVQLDPVDGQVVEAADGGVHVVRGFTGKAEHEVRADLHVGFFRQLNGLGRGRRVVPPVDAAQGGVVQCLDAKLKPFFFPRRGAEDSHFFRIEAVGPGSHGNPGEIGQGAENLQHRREPGGGAVGIRKGLQIREEQRGPVGLAEVLAPVLPLGGEVHSGKAEPRAGTYGVAEGAARAGERPVTVGAACPRVERDLLDPLAEALAEMDGECIPCMHQNGPFGRIAANAVAVHIF